MAEPEPTVRPRLVVVADVLAQHRFEMATGEDEHVVEALLAYGPHPALRESVRPGRPDGREHALDARRCDDIAEAGGELRATVTDEEAELPALVLQVGDEVAG